MSDEEYTQYEVNRRNEQEQRAKNYAFKETMYCLDRKTGETVWKNEESSVYSRFVQSSTPILADGKLLVMSAGRTVRCLDSSTGKQLWKQKLPGEFRDEFWDSSFLVVGRVAVVLCGKLSALNVSDGSILWQGEESADSKLHSSPVHWNGLVIVNTPGGKTVAYEVEDGTKKWQLDTGAGHSTPVVVEDRLLTYGGSRKNGLRCYELNAEKEPQEIWKFQRAADPGSSPVVVDGFIYLQGERRLACVDLASGKSQWQTMLEISNPRYTSVVAGGGQAFYAWEGILAFETSNKDYSVVYEAKIDTDGRLIDTKALRKRLKLDELEGEDGLAKAERIWQKEAIRSGPLQCATPALVDGMLIVRLRDKVVCYDLTRIQDQS